MKLPETYPLLAFIFFLGILTSYEDIQTRRIKNKWIALSVLYVTGFYMYIFFAHHGKNPAVMDDLIQDVLVNGVLSFFAGFALWKANIWPPGDAKLFFAYALLIPITFYSNGYFLYFPSFALLVNIFCVGFFRIVISTVLLEVKITTVQLWIKNLRLQGRINSAMQQRVLNNCLKVLQTFLGMTVVVFIIMTIKEKLFAYFKPENVLPIYIAFIFVYGYVQRFLFKMFKLWHLLLLAAIYLFFGFTMFNTNLFVLHLLLIVKMSIMFIFLGEGIGKLFRLYTEYLEKKESNSKIHSSEHSESFMTYTIADSGCNSLSIPFSPTIFCGVIITLIIKQSVIHFFLHILKTH